MGASDGRPGRKPARFMSLRLVLETLPSPLCGRGVERNARGTRDSLCANISRRRELGADGRRDGKPMVVLHCRPGSVDAVRRSMCLRGPCWPDLGGTAQVKSDGALLSSRRSVTISQRPHLYTTYTTPVPHFSWSKVLAGWGAVCIKNLSVAAGLRLSRPLSRDRCDLGIWRIPVLTRAAVVYRLARESTGIDVTVGTNARPAR